MQKVFNVAITIVVVILAVLLAWVWLRPCECTVGQVETIVKVVSLPCEEVTPTESPTPVVPTVSVTPTPTTVIPVSTPTQVPTEKPTQVPTEVPTQVPTEVPTQVPTEVPPTPKLKCNKGGGNGGEGCDPGNHPEKGYDDE